MSLVITAGILFAACESLHMGYNFVTHGKEPTRGQYAFIALMGIYLTIAIIYQLR